MAQPTTRRRRLLHGAAAAALGAFLVGAAWGADALPSTDGRAPGVEALGAEVASHRVASVAALGEVRIAPGGSFLGTPLGGLSGIAYDPSTDRYHAVSDDRSQRAPARLYELAIALEDGRLEEGDVAFTGVVTLTDRAGGAYPQGALDPEGIALGPSGTLFVSSEGATGAVPPVAPWVAEFDPSGRWLREMPLPDYYLPGPDRGVRDNLALESLGASPSGALLFTGLENALLQDGPPAAASVGSPSRVLVWDLGAGEARAEYVYEVAPWPAEPSPPTAYADNGLVELVALDEGRTWIAMERSYAFGVGNTVRLFEVSAAGATDVLGRPALAGGPATPNAATTPLAKRLVADVAALGIRPDNLEGMTWGPTLPDGRRTLVLVSDDNFNPLQVTQLVALAVEVVPDRAARLFVPSAGR